MKNGTEGSRVTRICDYSDTPLELIPFDTTGRICIAYHENDKIAFACRVVLCKIGSTHCSSSATMPSPSVSSVSPIDQMRRSMVFGPRRKPSMGAIPEPVPTSVNYSKRHADALKRGVYLQRVSHELKSCMSCRVLATYLLKRGLRSTGEAGEYAACLRLLCVRVPAWFQAGLYYARREMYQRRGDKPLAEANFFLNF